MKSSYTTYVPMKSHYNLDGTGRDSYITANNGGNYKGFIQNSGGKFERGEF